MIATIKPQIDQIPIEMGRAIINPDKGPLISQSDMAPLRFLSAR
ncbi:MAG TPA: hypothetical protein VF475_09605 [Sphingobium sp.]